MAYMERDEGNKCDHGSSRDNCAVFAIEEALAIEQFGLVHISPDGTVEVVRLEDDDDGL